MIRIRDAAPPLLGDPKVSQAYMRDDVALSVANYVKLVPLQN